MTAISSVYDTRRDLPGIQILRAIAAVAVVTHHTLEESNASAGRFSPDWLTTSGASGVDIFFVISGFIMLFISFDPEGRNPSPGGFLAKRFTRIYPFYWVCCLAMTAVYAVGFLRHNALGAGQSLASWLLIPDTRALIGVSWTLVYEIYFYLIFAATLALRSRLASATTTTAIIVLAFLAARAAPAGPSQAFLANPIALEFCLGLWLAWGCSLWKPRPGARWTVPAAMIGFLLLMLAPLVVPHTTTAKLPGLIRVLAWGAPATLVVFAFVRARAPTGWPGRLAKLVGDASYALYLTHEFVMIGYARLLKVGRFALLDQRPVALGVVLICICVGIAAHLFIERPLLTRTRRFAASLAGRFAARKVSSAAGSTSA